MTISITNPAHPLFHPDYAKLRGISGMFVLKVAMSPPFADAGIKPEDAVFLWRNTKISVKNDNSHFVTGRSHLGWVIRKNPRGKMWISVGNKAHPANVAHVIIHEMIHAIHGLEHGEKFNEILLRTTKHCFPDFIFHKRNVSRNMRYDLDFELTTQLIAQGIMGDFRTAIEYQQFIEEKENNSEKLFYGKIVRFNTTKGVMEGPICRFYRHCVGVSHPIYGMIKVPRSGILKG
jgi:hypothetical protein